LPSPTPYHTWETAPSMDVLHRGAEHWTEDEDGH
jgi:hypothetical protein